MSSFEKVCKTSGSACLLELATKKTLEETTKFYKNIKTADTLQQSLNSFEERYRKELPDEVFEKKIRNIHANVYWLT